MCYKYGSCNVTYVSIVMNVMSKYLVILLFVIAGSCKKNDVVKYSALYLNTCTSKSLNAEGIKLCFNSLNDSRCPADVVCGWAGTAIAKFTLTKNSISYPFTLSTLPGHPYSSDTVVAGYKFRLVNILPYPKISSPASPAHIHALLDISKF